MRAPNHTLLGCLDENHLCLPAYGSAMQALKRVITEIAPTDIPVLLEGECGTGKEVVAREIHKLSRRQKEPFIKLSCEALTASTWREWLNDTQNCDGTNRPSGQGTLFLDEISELDPSRQSKLLLALSDGHPPSEARTLDVRVISSTSRDLGQEMRGHRFLQELYYRINGLCLRLPPLRQCKEDIPTLVEYFLSKNAAALGLPLPSLGSQTLQVLVEHSWSGNIRELQNVTQNIVMLGEEQVAAELESARMESTASRSRAGEGLSLKQIARQASRRAERELILKALTRTHWNRKRAAQELQISYKAFLYKLKQFLENSDNYNSAGAPAKRESP